MEKMITGVLIDTQSATAKVVTIPKKLESYYAAINCRCIDITRRRLDGKPFDIVCDDEALLRDNPVLSAISSTGEPMLAGNLLLLQFDGFNDLRSLTKPEIAHCMRLMRKMTNLFDGSSHVLLTHCDY